MAMIRDQVLSETKKQLKIIDGKIEVIGNQLENVDMEISTEVTNLINDKLLKTKNPEIQKKIRELGTSQINFLKEKRKNSLLKAKENLIALKKNLDQYITRVAS